MYSSVDLGGGKTRFECGLSGIIEVVNAQKRPRWIDLGVNGEEGPKVWPGIYETKGTEVRFLFSAGKERPKQFTEKPAADQLLIVLKRPDKK